VGTQAGQYKLDRWRTALFQAGARQARHSWKRRKSFPTTKLAIQ
jgi:hypothetical protein